MIATAFVLIAEEEVEAYTVGSTSYCLSGTMADGTGVRPGSAASNAHPLGTKIYTSRPVFGLRRWTIRDRIGYGSQLDFWAPACSMSTAWGRRTISYVLGWPKAVKKARESKLWRKKHHRAKRHGGSLLTAMLLLATATPE